MFLAVAAGFSTTETLLYIRAAPGSDGDRILLALLRLALSFPLHLIAGAFTAARLSAHDVEAAEQGAITAGLADAAAPPAPAPEPPSSKSCVVLRALIPAVLIHGTFDLIAMGLPVLLLDPSGDGSGATTSGIITLFCCAVITAVSGVALAREAKALLQREDAIVAPSDGAEAGGTAAGGSSDAGAAAVSANALDMRPWSNSRPSSTVGVTAVTIELGPIMVDPPAGGTTKSKPTESDGVFSDTTPATAEQSLLLGSEAVSDPVAADDSLV